MPEEESAGKVAAKAAEHEEKTARREEAATQAGQEEPRRQEEGGVRGNRSKAAPQSELAAAGGYEYLVALNCAGMDAAVQTSEAMLKATGSLAEELTSFAYRRLHTDIETGRSLMGSPNDLGEAIDLQGRFAADAVRDYLEEMTKVASLGAQASLDVWAPLQDFSMRLTRGKVARPS